MTSRRYRLQQLLMGLTAFALGTMQTPAATPVEGRDYRVVEPAIPTDDPHSIVVMEFFSYRCPHCYAFADTFAKWSASQPKDVRVKRIPVSVGRPQWELAARTYLALAAMDSLPLADQAMYEAFHVHRLRLESSQDVANWIAKRNVSSRKFLQLVPSPLVTHQLEDANKAALTYRIPSIPAIVIDGRYVIPLRSSKDMQLQFAMIDELISRRRTEKK